MLEPRLYFVSDKYYEEFPDKYLEQNKEKDADGRRRRRPFVLTDRGEHDIWWLVPMSKQTQKYQALRDKKIAYSRNGVCDSILIEKLFVADEPRAFLIQNMCPITPDYLYPWIDSHGLPIRIKNSTYNKIKESANKVLSLQRNHIAHIIFPDIDTIYKGLEAKQLCKEQLMMDNNMNEHIAVLATQIHDLFERYEIFSPDDELSIDELEGMIVTNDMINIKFFLDFLREDSHTMDFDKNKADYLLIEINKLEYNFDVSLN